MKNNIMFYLAGAKNLALAKFNTMINGRPDEEVIEFRVNQCKNCPLLRNNICDPTVLVNRKGTDEIPIKDAENYPHIKDNFGEVRALVKNDEVYYRGCGCPIITDGKPDKPSYFFNEDSLERKDGLGPCPMGKWSKEEFVKYLEKKYGTDDSGNRESRPADL